jgi:Ni/Co efflux regulator RcnB
LKEEKAMLKTISAALLAVSVLAAPAFAAGTGKTAQAPAIKSAPVKQSVLNANAKMGRHHVRHARHHRFHKKMVMRKVHHSSKIVAKHVTHPAKRG